MTVRSRATTAQRYRVQIDGHTFILAKGANQYSRWYVLNEAGKYLTSGQQGKHTYEGAFNDARLIARQLDAAVPA